MKRRVLKPIAQDFMLMSSFANVCLIGVLVQYQKMWTLFVIIPLVLLTIYEVEMLDKYGKKPSLFFKGK